MYKYISFLCKYIFIYIYIYIYIYVVIFSAFNEIKQTTFSTQRDTSVPRKSG